MMLLCRWCRSEPAAHTYCSTRCRVAAWREARRYSDVAPPVVRNAVDVTRAPVTSTIAALYVQADGVYSQIPGVDPWPEARDVTPAAFAVESYCDEHRAMLADSHYLAAPPPGCLFVVAVRPEAMGLFGPVAAGPLLGVCLVGRPIARHLQQDGSVGEVVRLVLVGCPYGTASRLLRYAADVALARGMATLIAYHDRTRHTGCIYRKAGFRRDGATPGRVCPGGWDSRPGRTAGASSQTTPKRRWRLDL